MMRVVPVTVACLTLLVTTADQVRADILFSIHEEDVVAELLPFGNTPITESDSAFLYTGVRDVLHTQWTQIAVDGDDNVLYDITWTFADEKTVQNRFQNAVDVGEAVTWTVNTPSVEVFAGTWRFSSAAGPVGARFDSSGSNFSSNNGAWAVANNPLDPIDGTGNSAAQAEWGYGNWQGSDFYSGVDGFNGTLRLNGVRQTSLPAGFKNFMYVVTPTAIPEPSSLALGGISAVGMAFAAVRRRRRRSGEKQDAAS